MKNSLILLFTICCIFSSCNENDNLSDNHSEIEKRSLRSSIDFPGIAHNESLIFVSERLSYDQSLNIEERIEAVGEQLRVYVEQNDAFLASDIELVENNFDRLKSIYSQETNFSELNYWSEEFARIAGVLPDDESLFMKRIIEAAMQADENFIKNNEVNNEAFVELHDNLLQLKKEWETQEFNSNTNGEISRALLSVSLYSSKFWKDNVNLIEISKDDDGDIISRHPGLVDAGGAALGIIGSAVVTHQNGGSWEDQVYNGVVSGFVGGFTASVAAVTGVGGWLLKCCF